eukprot:gene7341-2703_t
MNCQQERRWCLMSIPAIVGPCSQGHDLTEGFFATQAATNVPLRAACSLHSRRKTSSGIDPP